MSEEWEGVWKGRGEETARCKGRDTGRKKSRWEGEAQSREGVGSGKSGKAGGGWRCPRDSQRGRWTEGDLKLETGLAGRRCPDHSGHWKPHEGCRSLILSRAHASDCSFQKVIWRHPSKVFLLFLPAHHLNHLPGAKSPWIMWKPLLLLLSGLPTEIINSPGARNTCSECCPHWLTQSLENSRCFRWAYAQGRGKPPYKAESPCPKRKPNQLCKLLWNSKTLTSKLHWWIYLHIWHIT